MRLRQVDVFCSRTCTQKKSKSIPTQTQYKGLRLTLCTSTQEPGWDKELEQDVKEECNANYGQVVHIGVAPGSTDGEIYVKFDRVQGGENAIKGLNGRFFGGQRITAQYLVDAVYNMNFPQAANV
jgi:RNA-binding protein 39